MTSIDLSGDGNHGIQMGINSGHIYSINNYSQPGEGLRIKLDPSSTVPFRRDPDFVDRNILAEVDKICSKPASRAALVGLGGVGKSQLAIEYSYRIREKFPQTWVFWVHASNAVRFEEGYRIIADRIKLPGRDEQTADILQLVSNWLSDEANGRWIIILDNADDSAVFSDPRKGGAKSDVGPARSLSNFLPQMSHGSILVTSRSGETALRLTGRPHDIIKVDPMDENCALLLFEKKVVGKFDKDDAKELLRALDYMPLAISQAATYISQRAPRTTVARYLDTFRKSDENQTILLDTDTGDLCRDSYASNSIITTWQISFEYLRGKRPSAARLLSLMSLFDRQGIPESLLHRYEDREDGSDIDLGQDYDSGRKNDSNMAFEEDLSTLMSYSLVRINLVNDQFEMHRLVQFSTRKWLELNCELEKWKRKYIDIIWKAIPTGAYENWKICQMLFPHAEAVLDYCPAEMRYLAKWSQVLSKAAEYADTQGIYLRAEDMSRRALDGTEKALGKEHPLTLTSVNNLALVLQSQGKYDAAEAMNRRALDGKEKALGKEHPNTLASVNNLALVLQSQGKYDAAEAMNRRALDGAEKALGKEHPDTLTTVSNLALVLQNQGKYEAAEAMSRRALDGREKALGKEHPVTLTSVNNLALVLYNQGKYDAAEAMNRIALDGNEKALGKEHPNTLTTVSNLASVLQNQGKYDAAEAMDRRALDGREKALGKEHPDTLMNAYCLAHLMHRQERYRDATPLYERSCAGLQKVLGTNHPKTLACSNHYAAMIAAMKADGDSPSSRKKRKRRNAPAFKAGYRPTFPEMYF